jgi:hypothetical protein
MLQDNIENFEDKFVIAKTINNGYHILYKTENPDRNKKLAKLKGLFVSLPKNWIKWKDFFWKK